MGMPNGAVILKCTRYYPGKQTSVHTSDALTCLVITNERKKYILNCDQVNTQSTTQKQKLCFKEDSKFLEKHEIFVPSKDANQFSQVSGRRKTFPEGKSEVKEGMTRKEKGTCYYFYTKLISGKKMTVSSDVWVTLRDNEHAHQEAG